MITDTQEVQRVAAALETLRRDSVVYERRSPSDYAKGYTDGVRAALALVESGQW